MFAPSAGTIIAGKYRVERTLGAGGMGLVLAAKHLELDQTVAIKVLLPHMLTEETLVSRFTREGKLAAKIESEHVARVLDVGRTEDGTPYMVMEYLEGQDLMAFSKARGPIPVTESVEFVLHACDAVAVAHAVGIIHRDLKPANLFLTHKLDGSPCVKVLDFGISKDMGGTNDGHTTGMMGSPIYMSPEQMVSSKNVDARTDIWSLGAILYRLVAARPPYDADSIVQLAQIMSTQPPVPLRSLLPTISPQFEAIVLKCLARRREDRYASIAELAAALSPFAPPRALPIIERVARIRPRALSQPAVSDVVTVAGGSGASTNTWGAATTEQMEAGTFLSQTSDIQLPMRGGRAPFLAAAAVLVLAGSVGGVMAFRHYRMPTASTPPLPSDTVVVATSTSAPAIPPPDPPASVDTSTVASAAAPSATLAKGAKPPGRGPKKPARGTADAGSGDSWGWDRQDKQ